MHCVILIVTESLTADRSITRIAWLAGFAVPLSRSVQGSCRDVDFSTFGGLRMWWSPLFYERELSAVAVD